MDRVGGGTLEQRIDGTEWISAWRYTYNFSQGVAWHVSMQRKGLDPVEARVQHAQSGTNVRSQSQEGNKQEAAHLTIFYISRLRVHQHLHTQFMMIFTPLYAYS
jgi:hypothetical protein